MRDSRTHVAAVAALGMLVHSVSVFAQRDGAASFCDKPLDAGTSARTVMSGQLERAYLLIVPRSYDGRTPLPALLAFHGSGSSAEEQLALARLEAAADQHDLLVVAPRAAATRGDGALAWNVPPDPLQPDDVAFVAALLDHLVDAACLDTARVYASGFSGGARFASLLACELGERLAAIGAVGGIRYPDACRTSRPVPVIAFHGTADPINPYDGGGQSYWGESVEAAFDSWGSRHAATQRFEERLSPAVTRLAFRGQAGRDDVVLYRLDAAGHVWPGTPLPLPDSLGPTSDEIDATAAMLEFFAPRALR
jgi:polyhydroxybutyrate depolymerase